jgi:hypothetical protein
MNVVHTEDSNERKTAKEIFDRAHADDVSSAGEGSRLNKLRR